TELAQQIEIAAEQHMRAEEFLKLAMLDPTTVQDRGRRLMPKAFLLSIGAWRLELLKSASCILAHLSQSATSHHVTKAILITASIVTAHINRLSPPGVISCSRSTKQFASVPLIKFSLRKPEFLRS